MLENETLKPIAEQIRYWIEYDEQVPDYNMDPTAYFKYRAENDSDCVLTDGNLLADTIFSLWGPMKRVLMHLNKDIKVRSSKLPTLRKIEDRLPEYLPPDNPMVVELSRLFVLGKTRANVMILPNRRMNTQRGNGPYWDYVPHFLHDCFRNGKMSDYFRSDKYLREWIINQHLNIFFEGDIEKDNLIDLLGCGSVVAPYHYTKEHIDNMLSSYNRILMKRSKYYPKL